MYIPVLNFCCWHMRQNLYIFYFGTQYRAFWLVLTQLHTNLVSLNNSPIRIYWLSKITKVILNNTGMPKITTNTQNTKHNLDAKYKKDSLTPQQQKLVFYDVSFELFGISMRECHTGYFQYNTCLTVTSWTSIFPCWISQFLNFAFT